MTDITSLRAICNPVAVRQDGGDVLIQLSPRPNDQYLIQRQLLAELMPSLAPLLDRQSNGSANPRWDIRSKDVGDPSTGEPKLINILKLGLFNSEPVLHDDPKSHELAWLLYGQDSTPTVKPRLRGCEEHKPTPFGYSSYADLLGFGLRQNHGQPQYFFTGEEAAVLEYKMLLNLLLGRLAVVEDEETVIISTTDLEPLTKPNGLDQYDWIEATRCFECDPRDPEDSLSTHTMMVIELLLNVTTRAAYHMCLPLVAPQIVKELAQTPNIWVSIARSPQCWAILSQILHWEDGFNDALRHLAGRQCINHDYLAPTIWRPLKDHHTYTRDNLEFLIMHQRNNMFSYLNRLRFKIDALALTSYPITRHGSRTDVWYYIKTIILRPGRTRRRGKPSHPKNDTNYRPSAPKHDKEERINFIACSVFSQKITDLYQTELSGRQGDGPAEYRVTPEKVEKCCWSIAPLRFWSVCKQILEANEARDVGFFGYRPGKTLSRWFILKLADEAADELVEERLLQLLEQAAVDIQYIVQKYSWVKECETMASVNYFTYCLDLPEDMLPWAEEEEWHEEAHPAYEAALGEDGRLRFQAATAQWLAALGMVPN